MSKVITFRMNGVGNAFLRELGCTSCPQCDAVKPRANTSGSLVVSDWKAPRGRIEHHLLFDCGAGVTDSLIDHGLRTITSIFISHSHPDHCLELDRIANSLERSGQPGRFPLYCSNATLADGPGRLFPWFFPDKLTHHAIIPFTPIVIDSGINLTVTPVPVWHGKIPKDPVIWVVEFGDLSNGSHRKIIIGWDLLHLIPRYPHDDADSLYTGPCNTAQELVHSHRAILENADELFVEANTYTPRPDTGHISVSAIMRSIIPLVQPRRTWVVHYSGHEDPFGPLSDEDLQLRLDRDKMTYGLSSHDLLVARHGMTLNWTL